MKRVRVARESDTPSGNDEMDGVNSEDGSDAAEDSDDALSEDDDIEFLPMQLLMYGENLTAELDQNCVTEYGYANDVDVTEINEQLLKIDQLYKKSYDLFLELNVDLKLLLDKSLGRDKDDNRVPPGSSAVKRDLNDKRFFLSLLCINKSIIADRRGGLYNEIIANLKEAVIWFPRSIEANYMLAKFLRPTADTEEKLQKVEYFLKKTIACGEQMDKNGENRDYSEEMGLYIKREEGDRLTHSLHTEPLTHSLTQLKQEHTPAPSHFYRCCYVKVIAVKTASST